MCGQLRRAKHKGQEVVVIEAPDAVRASGFQPVQCLDAAHDLEVSDKDFEHNGRGVWFEVEHAEFGKAQQERYEVEFVARAVVNSCAVAPRLDKVGLELNQAAGVGIERKDRKDFGGFGFDIVIKVTELWFTES